MDSTDTIPVVYDFRRLIAGHGYLAFVVMRGHALRTSEGEDAIWMYGVQPGGLAGECDAPFFESLASVLFDLAHEATNFLDFRRRVTAFFEETCDPNRTLWNRLAPSTARKPWLDVTCVQSSDAVPTMNAPDKVARAV